MVPSIHTNNTGSRRFSAVGRTSAPSRPTGRREIKNNAGLSSVRKWERKESTSMLRKLLNNTHGKQTNTSSKNARDGSVTHQHQHNQTLDVSIDDLYNNSRSGLRGVFIFLAVSTIALYFSEHSLAGSISADIMEQLGSIPPVILINCVFGASTLSSLIIITGRIYNNREPGKTSTHLWFRVFFYLLYFISGALGDYFNMVFISGLVVLGLQHYNVWNYYMRAIEINTNKSSSMNI